jgi:hypothetical protein
VHKALTNVRRSTGEPEPNKSHSAKQSSILDMLGMRTSSFTSKPTPSS